jgi:hypothetical protein
MTPVPVEPGVAVTERGKALTLWSRRTVPITTAAAAH